MRINSLIICFLFSQLSLYCQNEWTLTNWEDFNLKGRVKDFELQTYKAIPLNDTVQILKGEIISYKYTEFNKNGFIIKESYDKQQLSSHLSFYDSVGRKSEYIIYSSDGSLYNHWYYSYEKHDSILEEIYSPKNELTSKSWITLYDDGKLKEIDSYYYKNGNLENNLVRKFTYFEDLRTVYTYRIDSLCSYYFQEQGYIYVDRYDCKGNVIESLEVKNFNSSLCKNEYDEFGNKIFSRVIENQIISTKNFQYKYDKFHNWIWKLRIEDNIPIDITIRAINYYIE